MVQHCPNSRKIIFLDHLEINKIRGERKVKKQIGSCFISNNCTPLITQLGDRAIALLGITFWTTFSLQLSPRCRMRVRPAWGYYTFGSHYPSHLRPMHCLATLLNQTNDIQDGCFKCCSKASLPSEFQLMPAGYPFLVLHSYLNLDSMEVLASLEINILNTFTILMVT